MGTAHAINIPPKEQSNLISEGNALQQYLHNNKISLSSFAKKLNKSRTWVYDLFRLKNIPYDYKELIISQYSISFEDILSGKINNPTAMSANEFEVQELRSKIHELEIVNNAYFNLIKELSKP